MNQFKFLTSNQQKASDFLSYGVIAQPFNKEITEIKHEDVRMVALHKARDTGLNNIVVEDTALYIENSNIFGTDIKHAYDNMLAHRLYNNEKACWMVCLCAKSNNKFILSVGKVDGQIFHPHSKHGYHFEKFFAINHKGNITHFNDLPGLIKKELNPRLYAIENLVCALKYGDYSKVQVINEADVLNWDGAYQIEAGKGTSLLTGIAKRNKR